MISYISYEKPRETTLVTDLLLSRNALDRSSSKPNNNTRSYHTKGSPQSPQQQDQTPTDPQTCPACQSTHDLEDCDVYMGNTLEERNKFVGQKNLCYGCLAPFTSSHIARTCSQRRTCGKCYKNHPTSLHGVRIQKIRTFATNTF